MLKHVVQLTGLTALAVALSVGSVAQAAPVASVLTGDEMAFAFAAPVAADGVQVLSQGEMQATEGAIVWNGVIGGSVGLGSYLLTTPQNQWNLQDAAIETGIGIVTSYGAGSLIKVVGPYKSGGWGIAVNKSPSNPFTLQKNSEQAVRFNFDGIKPTTVHHRLNGTGFNRHSTYQNFFRGGR